MPDTTCGGPRNWSPEIGHSLADPTNCETILPIVPRHHPAARSVPPEARRRTRGFFCILADPPFGVSLRQLVQRQATVLVIVVHEWVRFGPSRSPRFLAVDRTVVVPIVTLETVVRALEILLQHGAFQI
jgi:hypothetical protein